MRISQGRIADSRIVNDRVHIEYAFTLTVFPVSSLISELLCRNNNVLYECLLYGTVDTCRVLIFYSDFILRSLEVLDLTYSGRIHSPYQIVRSIVFSIIQETEYYVGIMSARNSSCNLFFSVLHLISSTFIPVCRSIRSYIY